MIGSVLNIPHFVSSTSPKGLMEEMLKQNLKDGVEYGYFSIAKDGNKWVAWYFKKADISRNLKSGKSNGSN